VPQYDDPAGCTLRFGARTCLSLPGVRCACSVGRPSVSTLLLFFFVSRHPEPHLSLSPRRVRARCFLPSPRRLMRRSSSFSCGVSRAPPVFSFFPVPAPRGVGGAPRGALRERSRLRSATTVLARHGPSRATGRRLSALHRGGLWTARPRGTYPIVPRTMPLLPAAGRKASRSSPAASQSRLHRGFGTPHPAPPQNVSGDAPQ